MTPTQPHLRVVDSTTGELTNHGVEDPRIASLMRALEKEQRTSDSLRQQLKEAHETRAPKAVTDKVEVVWGAYYATAVSLNPKRSQLALGPQARRAIEMALDTGLWDADYLARSVEGILVEPYVIEGQTYDRPQHALLTKGTVDEAKIERFHDVALSAENTGVTRQAKQDLTELKQMGEEIDEALEWMRLRVAA